MKIEITRVESAFDGLSFGNIGAYEKVVGRALAEVDPRHPLNAGIINIGKAPIKAAGLLCSTEGSGTEGSGGRESQSIVFLRTPDTP